MDKFFVKAIAITNCGGEEYHFYVTADTPEYAEVKVVEHMETIETTLDFPLSYFDIYSYEPDQIEDDIGIISHDIWG